MDTEFSLKKVNWKNVFSLFGVIALAVSIIIIGVLLSTSNLSNSSNAAGISSGIVGVGTGGDLAGNKPPQVTSFHYYASAFDNSSYAVDYVLSSHNAPNQVGHLGPHQYSGGYEFGRCDQIGHESNITYQATFADGTRIAGTDTAVCLPDQLPAPQGAVIGLNYPGPTSGNITIPIQYYHSYYPFQNDHLVVEYITVSAGQSATHNFGISLAINELRTFDVPCVLNGINSIEIGYRSSTATRFAPPETFNATCGQVASLVQLDDSAWPPIIVSPTPGPTSSVPTPTPTRGACTYIGQACSAECEYPNHCVNNGYCCPPNAPEGTSGTGADSAY